jgi:hypothetical protein
MAGSGSDDEGGTAPTSDGGAKGDGETVSAAYPSGPYCTPAGSNGHLSAGCVLPNVSWMGYADESGTALASTEPYAAYSLGDARKSGKRYAMVNVAEFDCPGCQQSATLLGTENDAGVSAGASVEEAGGLVIEVLETAGFADVASKTDLDAWVSKYKLMVTTVADPGTSSTPSPSLALFGRRDQAYIIDLSTMKILQYIDGSIVAAGPDNSAGLAMTAMHKLLGK